MAHGMGIPSIGIYSYELYAFYGVENIIRIGSAGSKLPNMSVVISSKTYSNTSFAKTGYGYEENVMYPSEKINEALVKAAKDLGKEVYVGPTTSGDNFYGGNSEERKKYNPPFPEETLGGEMESFALFAIARYRQKNAACLFTVTDSMGPNGKEALPAEEREKALRDMMVIALEAAITLKAFFYSPKEQAARSALFYAQMQLFCTVVANDAQKGYNKFTKIFIRKEFNCYV